MAHSGLSEHSPSLIFWPSGPEFYRCRFWAGVPPDAQTSASLTLALPPQVNVLVSFLLPLALTAFLNGVTVSHLMALYSQVPSASVPGSSIPSRLELLSEEGLLGFMAWRKTLSPGSQPSLVRHKDAGQIRRLQHSARVLS